jgi:membrane protein
LPFATNGRGIDRGDGGKSSRMAQPAYEPSANSGRVAPSAQTPLDLDRGDWRSTAKRALREVKDDRVPFAAAGMAFYFFLAIFPALIALIGILGLIHVDSSGLVGSIRTTLPGGAGEAVANAVSRADQPSNATSLFATVFGILAALWSASSGFAGMESGLNIAYDIEHDRRFVKKRAVALLLLLATVVLGGVPSPFFGFGDSIVLTAIGWIVTVIAVVVLFSVFYYLAPNRDQPSWRWVSPGGLIGAAIWIVGSVLFAVYVSTFNSYGKTYGPLGGVIVLILWLYLSSLAVLLGGELNAELERQADRKASLPGPPS